MTEDKDAGGAVPRGNVENLMSVKELDSTPAHLNQHVSRNMEAIKQVEEQVRGNFQDLAEAAIKAQEKDSREAKAAEAELKKADGSIYPQTP